MRILLLSPAMMEKSETLRLNEIIRSSCCEWSLQIPWSEMLETAQQQRAHARNQMVCQHTRSKLRDREQTSLN